MQRLGVPLLSMVAAVHQAAEDGAVVDIQDVAKLVGRRIPINKRLGLRSRVGQAVARPFTSKADLLINGVQINIRPM